MSKAHKEMGKDFVKANGLLSTHRLQAVQAIRALTGSTLGDALVFVAEMFGFESKDNLCDPQSRFGGWREFGKWLVENKISLESVQGPHALTLLKMLAAKHGRTNVSEQPK